MMTKISIWKMVQERMKSFNMYSCLAMFAFCLAINLPGNITAFLIGMSLLFAMITGFTLTVDRLQSLKKSFKAVLTISLFIASFTGYSQAGEGKAILLRPGEVIAEGDTVQLVKSTLGNLYAHITYKYTGVPSVMIKRKGPVTSQYDGTVLFVNKVDQKTGVITLTGVQWYKFECQAVKAFQAGEIVKFKSRKQ
ncbi:MAG: hypothetical protein IT213_17000 [Cytophagales bacterium]|nr:hypothetical protein [Cytophagales bacterium]